MRSFNSIVDHQELRVARAIKEALNFQFYSRSSEQIRADVMNVLKEAFNSIVDHLVDHN